MANTVLYGFHNLQDRRAQRVTAVGVEIVNTAIVAAVAAHNRTLDQLIAFFCRRTTKHTERFKSVTAARLQPLDENGRTRPIKGAGRYDIAFPIYMGGGAWGENYVTGVKMTVEDAENATRTLLMADARWMRDHILAALYAAADYQFTDEDNGTLTIKPLANGDDQRYLILAGSDQGAPANNLMAQAANISDAANPFPGIYARLARHPENSGQVVALIPTNLVQSVQNLATFRPVQDANVREGANTAVLVGNDNSDLPGELIGYTDKVFIREWRHLPDNYIVAATTDGDKPLALREDEEAELRGFRQVAARDDSPWYERQYIRRAGFGASNRVGAVVCKIGGATYTVPVGYESPMY